MASHFEDYYQSRSRIESVDYQRHGATDATAIIDGRFHFIP